MKVTDIPDTAQSLRFHRWLMVVNEELRDIEFYSPTTPLHWQTYHDIIDRLVLELMKPEAGHGENI